MEGREKLPLNPPDLVAISPPPPMAPDDTPPPTSRTDHGNPTAANPPDANARISNQNQNQNQSQPIALSLSSSSPTSTSTTISTTTTISMPITTNTTTSIYSDQNQNRLKTGDMKIDIDIDINTSLPLNVGMTHLPSSEGDADFIYENTVKFFPSSNKDLEVMKNLRKVFVSRVDDATCAYKVVSERGEGVFETVQGETDGSIWSRYFRQQQKVILMKDKYQHGILKLDFGRSRTVSCCQTLRFAAMTAHFKSKDEEPLCIIFKDRGCCIYSCCSSGVTYETVPQLDNVHPFTVKTKRQWKNRAEFMVKHSDGSILAFIDREKKFYTLTMGENLKPTMKATLVGFVIAMDIMDREDAGKLNCYLRPSTYVTILFLLMLFFMIGAFLFHFLTAMILAWPKGASMGCTDSVHADADDPFLPPSGPNSTYPPLIHHSSAEVVPYSFNISSAHYIN